ncbi:type II toxin-antitoxin system VapC family toxin [Rhodopila sp.]|uniref:type II toxin-antitoxin system VapC family toxin n=1 Tax=Rhodopila sp. TaxID=2480087 RepID=UPI003D14A681
MTDFRIGTLVDTNILLDIVTNDPCWMSWSRLQLSRASVVGPLLINDVVYAELSVRFESIETLETALTELGVRLEPIPRAALFLAAKAFRLYRSRGGTRTGVLSDFFVGAHAAVLNCALLTRDAGRYRHYFPT